MNLVFSKGFDGAALRKALAGALSPTQLHGALQGLPLLGTRRIVNPRAGWRVPNTLAGSLPVPPIDASRETAGELLELAAMALLRDVPMAMAIGRNWAGIHTRSSLLAGLQLGQRHAIRHLQILRQRATEPLGRTTFTGFDGVPMTV